MISIPNSRGWEGASLIFKNLPSKLYGHTNDNDGLLFWPLGSESTIELKFFVSERCVVNKKSPALLLTITATSATIKVTANKHPNSKYFFSEVFTKKVLKKVEKMVNELLLNHNQLN